MFLKESSEIIFAYDKEVLDCQILRDKNIDLIDSKIYFKDILLTGSSEYKFWLFCYTLFYDKQKDKFIVGFRELK